MVWNCRLIDKPRNDEGLVVGDMFYTPIPKVGAGCWASRWVRKPYLSDFYFENNLHRHPILLLLPGRILCPVDGRFLNLPVTGDVPALTIHGILDFPGRYRGRLENGVLTDDLEGRQFENGPNFCTH